jgi:iron complex transport system ATP-binding protein
MSLLDVKDVCFSRQARGSILENISFSLEKSQILAILGANGAGKTSLLSLIGGRLVPSKGSIRFEGIGELDAHSTRPTGLAKKLAYLPQIERLPFNYRVLDFVLMGRTPHIRALALPSSGDEHLAREALASLGLSALEEQGAGDISGGEFQLARIARCLAQEAEFLLLDEPTSLLDPANAHRVSQVLIRLAKGGVTIIFTTHDVGLAFSIADRVLVLRKGEMLDFGLPGLCLTKEKLSQAFDVELSYSVMNLVGKI